MSSNQSFFENNKTRAPVEDTAAFWQAILSQKTRLGQV